MEFAVYCREKKWRRTKEEGRGDGRGLASRWEHDMILLLETCITTGINCIRERLINGRCSSPHTPKKDGRRAPYSRKTSMQQCRAINRYCGQNKLTIRGKTYLYTTT